MAYQDGVYLNFAYCENCEFFEKRFFLSESKSQPVSLFHNKEHLALSLDAMHDIKTADGRCEKRKLIISYSPCLYEAE